MVKNYSTRIERRNAYTEKVYGMTCKMGWMDMKKGTVTYLQDPDRITLIPKRTKTGIELDRLYLQKMNEFFRRKESEMFMVVNPGLYKFLVDAQS